MSLKRKLAWAGLIAVVLLVALACGGLLFSVNRILAPSFLGVEKDFSKCTPEVAAYFGKGCGNLRVSREFAFREVSISSLNGYELPGWLVRAVDNGKPQAAGVIMLVAAGGSDRREDTRHIGLYLSQGLDVLTFDYGCSGEAPCPKKGLTYGERESRDVLSVYRYLTGLYHTVYAMGSSVGAASILIALPEMPSLAGVVAENPYTSFERLIREAPQSKSVPRWATNTLIDLTRARGDFHGGQSPENSLTRVTANTPILFIHSKRDKTISYEQTRDLARSYSGPKTVWLPKTGEHALVRNANPGVYEANVAAFLRTTQ